MIWLLAISAVLCNATAQLAMKLASQTDRVFIQGLGPWLSPWVTPWILAALTLYGASFVLTVRIFSLVPLSLATPVMAGATFLLVSISSALFLGEQLSDIKILGMLLIIAGIYCLVR